MTTAFYLIAALLLGFFLYTAYRRYQQLKNYNPADESPNILTLTDDNFDRLSAKGVVLVDFWAAWCMPCKMLAPTISELADEYAGKATIAKLDVDKNPKTAANLGIRSIPTLILFENGQPLERFVGVKPKNAFQKALNSRLHKE
ncbi:MAG: thioredoxin [Bacteroidales bacterium]|nr:thioredoxin [Bacteroidales bacterium]